MLHVFFSLGLSLELGCVAIRCYPLTMLTAKQAANLLPRLVTGVQSRCAWCYSEERHLWRLLITKMLRKMVCSAFFVTGVQRFPEDVLMLRNIQCMDIRVNLTSPVMSLLKLMLPPPCTPQALFHRLLLRSCCCAAALAMLLEEHSTTVR